MLDMLQLSEVLKLLDVQYVFGPIGQTDRALIPERHICHVFKLPVSSKLPSMAKLLQPRKHATAVCHFEQCKFEA
eukprot:4501073-Pyramimonas_sp.AAC.1